MSGPKDFVFVFAAGRLIEMMARRASLQQSRRAEAQARRQAVRERMQDQSQGAAVHRARVADKARQAAENRFRALAEQNSVRLSGARETKSADFDNDISNRLDGIVLNAREGLARMDRAMECAGDSERQSLEKDLESLAGGSHDSRLLKQAEEVQERILRTAEHVEVLARRWQEAATSLRAWQEQLPDDTAVCQFQSSPLAQWCSDVAAILDQAPKIQDLDGLVARAEALDTQADAIHSEASEQKSRFDERNELLADILKSLQEIGFFVSDPIYENPNDPAGPVLIKATRGTEEVNASVDLSDVVRTVWNGIPDEKCKDSFFQYVDQLGKKDLVIKPVRADLQERPILKQSGARELPRSTSREEGV